MHTYTAPNGLRIHYNSDGSGEARIIYEDRIMSVPGADIVPLIEGTDRLELLDRVFMNLAVAGIITGPDGQPIFHGVDGEWVEAAKGIVEKIARNDDFFAGEYDCLFCHGLVHYGGDEVESFVDHVEHANDCPIAVAKRLKEGTP